VLTRIVALVRFAMSTLIKSSPTHTMEKNNDKDEMKNNTRIKEVSIYDDVVTKLLNAFKSLALGNEYATDVVVQAPNLLEHLWEYWLHLRQTKQREKKQRENHGSSLMCMFANIAAGEEWQITRVMKLKEFVPELLRCAEDVKEYPDVRSLAAFGLCNLLLCTHPQRTSLWGTEYSFNNDESMPDRLYQLAKLNHAPLRLIVYTVDLVAELYNDIDEYPPSIQTKITRLDFDSLLKIALTRLIKEKVNLDPNKLQLFNQRLAKASQTMKHAPSFSK
jgi:hypothetical protein